MKIVKQTAMTVSFTITTDGKFELVLLSMMALFLFVKESSRGVRQELRRQRHSLVEDMTNVKKVVEIVVVSALFGIGINL